MAQDKHSMRWRVTGHSVRGATHERRGRPNQDAIHWLPQFATGLPLILAVADGHGSQRSFRSERGARLAVETAAEVISEFLAAQTQSMSATRRAAEEWLPVALVRRWLDAVAADLAVHPLSRDELDLPGVLPVRGAADEGPANLQVAYGTTLLATAVTDSFILYLQLGDGEILTVSSEGEVLKPLPKDERLFANETTSLCSEDAWRDFRVSFQVFTHAPPALILLSTDGYSNSFRDERGFLKVGPDILEMIRTVGLDTVDEQMSSWLTESTYAGSGDDVTLGLICSEDAVGPSAAPEHEPCPSGQGATRQGSGNTKKWTRLLSMRCRG
jgi:hypothetical protein